MNVRYLERKDVPSTILGGYAGKNITVKVVPSVSVPLTAGRWDGGSKEEYYMRDINSGAGVYLVPGEYTLAQGTCIVERSVFMGNDGGLRIYISPADVAKTFPTQDSVVLSDWERMILNYTKSRKSSYMGKTRFDMAKEDFEHGYMKNPPNTFPTQEQWDQTKNTLINQGYLDKRGAITTSGKNLAEYI